MKEKTSVSLSTDVLERIGEVDPGGNRSEFIETAVRYYLARREKETRDYRDLAMINERASRLNDEAADSLKYQKPL